MHAKSHPKVKMSCNRLTETKITWNWNCFAKETSE